ncbi:hypothetical protein [Jejudonia soesokkakensis]
MLLLAVMVSLQSCLIQDPKPEECDIIDITVTDIYETSSYDIVFKDGGTDFYYINRGTERGLTVAGLDSIVLGKKVTLHLPRLFYGTSEHIAQLAIGDNIIFTEFSSERESFED